MTIEILHKMLEADPPQGRYVVVTPQQRGKGSTTARNLLSALVSLPGHYAAKSWLTERLRRYKGEVDEEDDWGGMARVHNIVTLLRGLLCPPGIEGEKELRKALVSYVPNRFESGPGYQLTGAPLRRLDVDVIEASVKEASLVERRGQNAISVWEQAYALAARGEYLLDERYSNWAESKRREVEGYQRQAAHALHRLYLTHKGEAAEEQVLGKKIHILADLVPLFLQFRDRPIKILPQVTMRKVRQEKRHCHFLPVLRDFRGQEGADQLLRWFESTRSW
ncbi:MAG: hypothetical protein H0V70_13040 [Ktedonobacteraceae bacterium]|nr:hypothetical protein [Ktedonobacteraceae bacterium]